MRRSSKSSSVGAPFKSPLLSKSSSTNNSSSTTPVGTDKLLASDPRELLQARLVAADKDIAQMEEEGVQLSQLDTLIEELHLYNDVRDTASELIGRLAHLRSMTVGELYEEMGLSTDD